MMVTSIHQIPQSLLAYRFFLSRISVRQSLSHLRAKQAIVARCDDPAQRLLDAGNAFVTSLALACIQTSWKVVAGWTTNQIAHGYSPELERGPQNKSADRLYAPSHFTGGIPITVVRNMKIFRIASHSGQRPHARCRFSPAMFLTQLSACFTRSLNDRDVPYIVAGAGGYWNLHYMVKVNGAAIQTPYQIPGADVTL